MNYIQLISALKKIPEEELIISRSYRVGNEFNFSFEGVICYLTLPKHYKKWSTDYVFKQILNSIENNRNKPKKIQASWEQSIEMLYHHYMYGKDNNSNCLLLDKANNILAIQYNGLNTTSIIKTDANFPSGQEDFIVINNKKKLYGQYKLNDYDNLIPLLKKICVE